MRLSSRFWTVTPWMDGTFLRSVVLPSLVRPQPARRVHRNLTLQLGQASVQHFPLFQPLFAVADQFVRQRILPGPMAANAGVHHGHVVKLGPLFQSIEHRRFCAEERGPPRFGGSAGLWSNPMTTATGSPCWATFIQARLPWSAPFPPKPLAGRPHQLVRLGVAELLVQGHGSMRQRLIQRHGAPLPVVHVATGHQTCLPWSCKAWTTSTLW